MGLCIDKLSHSCGTRKGLQVYANEETGKVDGFCWSCKKYVANPYGEKRTIDDVELPEPKTEEEIQATIAEVSGYPSVDLPSRKLRASDLDFLDIKSEISEEDGKTPVASYCPVTKDGKRTGYYVKPLFKEGSPWAVGEVKDCDLIGWEQAKKSGAYRLIITEGWLDAVAVNKIYKAYGNDQDYHPAIVSLSNGTNSVKTIAKHAADIRRLFKEVVLCFDNDEPGQNAVNEAMVLLPNALSVVLPCKDANDCVLEGKAKAAFKALAYKAEKPKNTRLVSAGDLYLKAREPTPYGELTWPFPTMNKLMRNIRYGETIYIGAGVKMGKSELLNAIAGHFIKNHDIPVFIAKPEEENVKSYKQMANKMVGKIFTDPSIDFDYDAFDEAAKLLEDKLYMVNLYQHLGWDTLKQDIIAAAASGCKAVFIDPITNLTNGMPSSEANVELQKIAQELSAMALDLNIVVFIFVHLKAHDGNIKKESRQVRYKKGQYYNLGNCPHELGGDILSSQFAGSRAMMRSCNLMVGLAGNKDQDLEDEIGRMRWLTILEDREFGNNNHVPIIWNPKTSMYKEY